LSHEHPELDQATPPGAQEQPERSRLEDLKVSRDLREVWNEYLGVIDH
jgi:hypothetical protein